MYATLTAAVPSLYFQCPRTKNYIILFQTDEWRLSEVNKDFSVCPSYPSLLTVPKDIDDETLCKAASFRHGGRFPVLSYYHKKNGMVSGSLFVIYVLYYIKICVIQICSAYPLCCPQVMMRAGQPLTGTNGRRCKEDEKLINATLCVGKRGYIIDTRTIAVAQQAKARGGGFEQEANYPQWRRINKAIERFVPTKSHTKILLKSNQILKV